MNQQRDARPHTRRALKATLQALAIAAVSLGFAQAILFPLFQDRVLSSQQRWEVEYLNGGTMELLAARLNEVPTNERPDLLSELSDQFGFTVALNSIEDIELDAGALQRLFNNEVVGNPTTNSVYRLLDDGEQLLIFDNTLQPSAFLVTEAQRRHMGSIAMLESLLQGQPVDARQSTIAAIAERFDYPIDLLPISEVSLSADQLNEINQGRIAALKTAGSETADYPADFIYKKFGDDLIVLGPLSPPTLRRFYPVVGAYYALLGLIILVPLGFWVAPSWRSMIRLSNATAAFGHGDFSVRATPSRGSKLDYLTETFNQMAGKIQSLIDSNKALINAVSHELRTPIARIEFNIELARKSVDITERNKQLDHIEESVDTLRTMVAEMLQYARFDREKPSFKMESVEIIDWLHSEQENWNVGDNRGPVRISISGGPANAAIERYYMSRAVSNLVLNARRFARATIAVEAEQINGDCRISVSDDGPGVPNQERTRIFEPFVRHDESRNRESGGTGLGLAIVKQIVAWHSGDVWVEDSPSGGAKFVIQWPQTGI